MDVIIRDSYDEISKYAAEVIAGHIKAKPDCVLGFATGSTPIGTYRELIRMHREGLDFSGVRTFNLDEYLGLGINLDKPYDEDQSYARFMYEELFKHINIKKENIHIPDGKAGDPEAFCRWYEEEIKRVGDRPAAVGNRRQWALGFNEPGSPGFKDKGQALTEQTLNDNYQLFYKKAECQEIRCPILPFNGNRTILEAKTSL